MARQTALDRQWDDLMALCQREKDYLSENRHPKLSRFVTEQIDRLAAQLGFSDAQITSREFRAEKTASTFHDCLLSRFLLDGRRLGNLVAALATEINNG